MAIKKYIDNLVARIGVSIAKLASPVIKEAIDNPENLKFEGYIKKDEIIVRIKLKDEFE